MYHYYSSFMPLLCSPTRNGIDISFFLFTIISASALMFFLYKNKKKQANKQAEKIDNIKNQNLKDKTQS